TTRPSQMFDTHPPRPARLVTRPGSVPPSTPDRPRAARARHPAGARPAGVAWLCVQLWAPWPPVVLTNGAGGVRSGRVRPPRPDPGFGCTPGGDDGGQFCPIAGVAGVSCRLAMLGRGRAGVVEWLCVQL